MRANIITQAQADGLELKVSCNGNLSYVGTESVVQRWLPTLKLLKWEIIDALNSQAANDAGAVEIPPEITVDRTSIKSCAECFHITKPGLSDGYCAERTDTPLAYGINHPLHQLPADGGASCTAFKEHFK